MKKLLKSLVLFAAAAMALTSCENEAMNEGIETNDTYTLTFTTGAPESKTSVSIDGEKATFAWSEDDTAGFVQYAVGAEKINKKNSKNISIDENGAATFTTEFATVDGATSFNYGAFYPGNNWVSNASFSEVYVKVVSTQKYTEGTFASDADLMMSKPIMGVTTKDGHGGNLEFARLVAIGKMTLTGVEEGEVISSVKFTINDAVLAGKVNLDFENSTVEYATEGDNYIEIYGDNMGTEIYFTCFPGSYTGAYTIDVTTDKATYKKEGEFTKAFNLTAGNVLTFTASAGTRTEIVQEEGTTNDVLTRESTGVTSGSSTYTAWTYTGTSGAEYSGNSAGGNDGIQLRWSTDKATSGIITTESGGYATKVAVVWGSTTSGRTLNIYGKNSAYSEMDDLKNDAGELLGTIVCGTSTEFEIPYDVQYIGLRSNSGAMYPTQITITWAEEAAGKPLPEAQTLSFAEETYTYDLAGDTAFEAPTVQGDMTTVTYTSSNESVATVDDTGKVTINTTGTTGTTTITATAVATDTYKEGSASYTLTVTNSASGDSGEEGGEATTYTETFANYKDTLTSSTNSYQCSGSFAGVSEDGITWSYTACGNPNQTSTDITTLQSKGLSYDTGVTMGKSGTLSATITGNVTSVSFYALTSSKATCTVTITNGDNTTTQTIAKSTSGKVEITGITGNSGTTTISFKEASTQNRVTIAGLTYTK